ncbi:MAG: hypothetical protein ACPHCI_09645, partial [Solirubrobacterales bacterium]
MKRSGFRVLASLAACATALLALPTIADAAALTNVAESAAATDTLWVLLCAFMVFFMLTGFAALEVGLVRGKNAGSIIAKILVNASIAAIAFWISGFALGFGGDADLFGTTGFFLNGFSDPLAAFPAMSGSNASIYAKFLFQYGFAAVVLAIAVLTHAVVPLVHALGVDRGLEVVAVAAGEQARALGPRRLEAD